jgi:hypothetical protein
MDASPSFTLVFSAFPPALDILFLLRYVPACVSFGAMLLSLYKKNLGE